MYLIVSQAVLTSILGSSLVVKSFIHSFIHCFWAVERINIKCQFVRGEKSFEMSKWIWFSFFFSSQDSELLWNHVPWLLAKNQEIAVKVQ